MPGDRWRRAAVRFGPLIVAYNAILAIRHDWTGMIFAPVAAAAILGIGYLYGRNRRRKPRS